MLGRLILLFIVVPLADLFLLIWMSQHTGLATTIAVVIVSGVIGAYLARRSSHAVMQKIGQSVSRGQFSPDLLTDGAMIFLAAGLLLTPGFITDFFGFTILIPVCRNWYKSLLAAWFKRHFKVQVMSGPLGPASRPTDANTVEGEVVSRSDDGPEPTESGHKSD